MTYKEMTIRAIIKHNHKLKDMGLFTDEPIDSSESQQAELASIINRIRIITSEKITTMQAFAIAYDWEEGSFEKYFEPAKLPMICLLKERGQQGSIILYTSFSPHTWARENNTLTSIIHASVTPYSHRIMEDDEIAEYINKLSGNSVRSFVNRIDLDLLA